MVYKVSLLLMWTYLCLGNKAEECTKMTKICSLKNNLEELDSRITILESAQQILAGNHTVKENYYGSHTPAYFQEYINGTVKAFVLQLKNEIIETRHQISEAQKSLQNIEHEILLLTNHVSDFESRMIGLEQKQEEQCGCENETVRHLKLTTDALHDLQLQLKFTKSDVERLDNTSVDVMSLLRQLFVQDANHRAQIDQLQQKLTAMEAESRSREQEFLHRVEAFNEDVQTVVHTRTADNITQINDQISYLKIQLDNLISTSPANYSTSTTEPNSELLDEAFRQISELRKECSTKDEIEKKIQAYYSENKTVQPRNTISNKCSVKIQHEPKPGRTRLHLVMAPPRTGSDACP